MGQIVHKPYSPAAGETYPDFIHPFNGSSPQHFITYAPAPAL